MTRNGTLYRRNPLEIRESRQRSADGTVEILICRNPLEIRASRQSTISVTLRDADVVIPWKSGQVVRDRSFAQRECQDVVIPWKSGQVVRGQVG